MPPLLELRSVSKSFGSLQAIREVSLAFRAGEITALIGENGAGKTTLMRIAAGSLRPDSGELLVDGEAIHLHSPADATRAGIEIVHQNFSVVPQFSVAENLALTSGHLPFFFSRRGMSRAAAAVISRSGLASLPLEAQVSDLSVGERASIDLIKALSRRPRLLILDEPTSVLTPAEVETLSANLRSLASSGTAVVFVTHKLREVFEISDRIFVMRGGRLVLETPTAGCEPETLARAMTGESGPAVPARRSPAVQPGKPRLELRGISLARSRHGLLQHIDLTVNAGEIVAIVGVAGNGQRELAEVVRGISKPSAGSILLDGLAQSPAELVRSRAIGYIPPDRTRDGIVSELDLAENLGLGHERWKRREGDRRAVREIGRYSIRATGPRQRAGSLSGGNQQKVVLARALERDPRLVVAAEPTRGLDLGSTAFIHDRLRRAAEGGAAILLITSDLDEALALAGALHVIYRGKLGPRLGAGTDRGSIGAQMAGFP